MFERHGYDPVFRLTVRELLRCSLQSDLRAILADIKTAPYVKRNDTIIGSQKLWSHRRSYGVRAPRSTLDPSVTFNSSISIELSWWTSRILYFFLAGIGISQVLCWLLYNKQ